MRFPSARPTVEATPWRRPCGRAALCARHSSRNDRRHRRGGRCRRPTRWIRVRLTQARAIKSEVTTALRSTREPEARRDGGVPDRCHRVVPLCCQPIFWSFASCRPTTASTTRSAPCGPPARTAGPRRGRPASAFVPRRQALELALRTFLETSATVVSVSLPTPGLRLLPRRAQTSFSGVDMAALAKALGGNPARSPAATAAPGGRRDHALPGCSWRSASSRPLADERLSVRRRSGRRLRPAAEAAVDQSSSN